MPVLSSVQYSQPGRRECMNFKQFYQLYEYLGILLHLCSSGLKCLVQYLTLNNFDSDCWTQPAAGHARSEVMGLGNNELTNKVNVCQDSYIYR